MKHDLRAPYTDARRAQYPTVGDQLDELWRAIEALAAGQPLPASVTDMQATIAAVKSRHLKPDQEG